MGGRGRRRRQAQPDPATSTELSCRLCQFFTDVTSILDRPFIAITLFILGVFFIVLASKQVKLLFEYLEILGIGERPRDGILGHFMALFVFLFVWFDVYFFTIFKNWAIVFITWSYRWYLKLVTALEDIQAYEELKH